MTVKPDPFQTVSLADDTAHAEAKRRLCEWMDASDRR
ncbi:hypothetical protein GGR30_000629 [Martelella radicis]|uniref:Uncharacterized protein n=1 Tax=Martelella radicis TaxID=1397476 RepID=A0A7W6KGC7_9HYPH|nr:hypothetical protein [Martelella radicis]